MSPSIGMVEWFQVGDHDRVEQTVSDLRRIGVAELRTGVSWAEWCTPEGAAWIGWLLPRLSSELRVVPCLQYTPPSLGLEHKVSSPPRKADDYADFVETVLARFGGSLTHVEFWNEPTNPSDWDHRLDPEWAIYGEMVAKAAARAHRLGWRTVLGGMRPHDAHWLRTLAERGVLENVDVVGLHGFPGTWDFDWEGWPALVARVGGVLEAAGLAPEIWITQTGFSTWRHDQRGQVATFMEALAAPVSRVYWHAVRDLHPDLPHRQGFHADERCYHLGLLTADGTPKLLYRLWSTGGLDAVRQAARFGEAAPARGRRRPVMITGGAGFIGTNLAHRLLSEKRPVLLFDNLSRPGVEDNLRWLAERHGDLVQVEVRDVRDFWAVKDALRRADQVFHFAGQVAVTTSLAGPLEDFEVNVRGTLNLLEALRSMKRPPPLVFTSTNKVYGGLSDVRLRQSGSRWEPEDDGLRGRGVSEARPLDFHSPYGCSKGAADQYVLDYARTFGIPAVVFRMSCIYGLHQQGTEDQGWVSHFVRRVVEGSPITLYGDGLQVRDVLFVEDLVEAFLLAQLGMERLAGRAFNMGGGPERTVSLLELVDLLGRLHGTEPRLLFDGWRPGDQRYYVSDTTRFSGETGWRPAVGVEEGVGRLYRWLTGPRRGVARGAFRVENRAHELRARRS
jgi:CDP-paratose 2-epimerase